jgi:NADPH:quinone reductase-like Zn-dependent oxidoreductase
MRAVIVREFGAPELLELADVPTPEPGPGQVRIKVAAAAVNPVDLQTRAGRLPIEQLPVGLGWDVAGVIDSVGPSVQGLPVQGLSVQGFAVGDAVVGLDDRLVKDLGPYADYHVLAADAVAAAPRTVDAVAASTLPLNAVTAAQALELADLAPEQTLLVTGAAGAVGGYAVELAAARGWHVVAIASPSDEATVRGFGARTFLPRPARVDDLAAAVRSVFPDGVDAVLDTTYQPAAVLGAVRDGGGYVNIAPALGPVASERGIRILDQWVHHDGARLAELVELVDAGRLTLRVAETFPLTEAAAAHELAGKGGLRGRVVLVP